ncbi:MAG: hypothetical protein WC089_00155 [Candidatus Paceibacterota bacterium]
MNENKFPIPHLNLDENKKLLEKEGEERCADWLARFPEKVVSTEERRDAEKEIMEFEGFIINFEKTHSLSELNKIIDLNPEDSPNHPLREPARLALIPIVTLISTLKNETDISEEKLKELKSKYMILSRAVGMINKNKVDHNR